MGNGGVHAVNATILSNDTIRLVDICIDEREDIVNFFHVLAKGIESDEWYLKIDRTEVESSGHPRAKEILREVNNIGDFLAKDCGDVNREAAIHEAVWDLTWVW